MAKKGFELVAIKKIPPVYAILAKLEAEKEKAAEVKKAA